jgi:hypothetical protein
MIRKQSAKAVEAPFLILSERKVFECPSEVRFATILIPIAKTVLSEFLERIIGQDLVAGKFDRIGPITNC